ncbi:MAG: type III-B CRISPR-associated protein Cas10/Cmr2 [Zestosphaera tikiterensis]|uniref:Type III-B CRISPR-associated protein Cas10/Cmr2 n=1 Tax=Zestosphaera tikiterensis TaxID=1973259 RepID=A0A2R7Y1C7_9CREN|nr:MAG: type III-B CRISPR-associated protein Cas10/Cmr2 [Zestosphaera tikiterensis]
MTVSFYAFKLAALLHDPAWKPWVVSTAFIGKSGSRVGRVLARYAGSRPAGEEVDACRNLVEDMWVETDAHEQDAAIAAKHILEDLDELGKVVYKLILRIEGHLGHVDAVAASTDRWLYTQRGGHDKVGIDEVDYVNILDPRFKTSVKPTIGVECVCKYVKELRDVLSMFKDLPLPVTHNLLYLLLEPLWYKNCPECVPLVDTRVPTHTVFDHVYATASIANWYMLGSDKPVGFLVKIDIPGIQKFISAARKTRDIWAGSWLISLLVWKTVSDVVMLLGGDIILSPFTSSNHFYIASLLKEIENHDIQIRENLEEPLRKAYLWKGVANQPLIPGTIFLALPCIDDEQYKELLTHVHKLKTVNHKQLEKLLNTLKECSTKFKDEVAEYFYEEFREAWRGLARSILKSYVEIEVGEEDLAKEFVKNIEKGKALDDISGDHVERYVREVLEEPPLALRVVVVDVEKAYEELKERLEKIIQRCLKEINETDLCKDVKAILSIVQAKDPASEIANKLFFHYLMIKLGSEEKKLHTKEVTLEPGFLIGDVVEEVTSEVYRSDGSERFHECTICGKLPSIIHVKRENLDDLAQSLGLPHSMFSEDERLCPYCLLRRLLTVNKALSNVMNDLNLYARSNLSDIYPRVPSTDELAALNALLKLVEKISETKYSEKLKKLIAGEDAHYSEYLAEPVSRYIDKCGLDPSVEKSVKDILGYLQAELEISYLLISGTLRSVTSCKDALKDIPTKNIEELCKVLAEMYNELRREVEIVRYYGVVRGDGDNFSKVTQGILDFEEGAEDYVESLKKAVKNNEAVKKLEEVYMGLSKLVKIFACMVHDMTDEPEKLHHTTVIVSPAYYIALSRGQIMTALLDAEIITSLGGFPVYAGGDDVAALVPVYVDKKLLDSLIEAHFKSTGLDKVFKIPANSDSVVGQAVLFTRRNYWGLLSRLSGFHKLPSGSVYPAPVAFGRSYGVLGVHYRDPFTPAWNLAQELEELKDLLKFEPLSYCEKDFEKDLVTFSYGRISVLPVYAGVVVIRNNLWSKEGVVTNPELVGKPMSDVLFIYEHVGEDKEISTSFYTDLAESCGLIKEALTTKATVIQQKLLKYVVERNRRNTPQAGAVVNEVLSKLSASVYEDYVVKPAKYHDKFEILCTPQLSIQLVMASKALHSMVR